MNTKKIVLFLMLIIFLSANQCLASFATSGSVYLRTEPGSWVGGGIGAEEVLWSHGVDGIFSVERNWDKGIDVTLDDGNHWTFNFAAPTYDPVTNTNDGNDLVVGFYNNATRYPFNSPTRPGLNFSGNGRGNNRLGGWFNVLDVSYDISGEVLTFAVDFRQFDESEDMLGASTYGSLRINSSIPINQTPIPSSALLLIAGIIFLCKRKRGYA